MLLRSPFVVLAQIDLQFLQETYPRCFICRFALRFVLKTEILSIIMGFYSKRTVKKRKDPGTTFPKGTGGHMQKSGEPELKQRKVIQKALLIQYHPALQLRAMLAAIVRDVQAMFKKRAGVFSRVVLDPIKHVLRVF